MLCVLPLETNTQSEQGRSMPVMDLLMVDSILQYSHRTSLQSVTWGYSAEGELPGSCTDSKVMCSDVL